MKQVEVYTSDYCPYCIRVKRLLKKENIEFTEINIGRDDQKRLELEEKTNIRTVPQVFVDGEFIGDCDRVHDIHRSGKFDKLFK